MNCFNVGLSDYSLSAYAKEAAFSFDQSVMLERLIFTPCSYQHTAGASVQSRSLCPIQPLLHLPSLTPYSLCRLLLMSCNNTHSVLSEIDQADRWNTVVQACRGVCVESSAPGGTGLLLWLAGVTRVSLRGLFQGPLRSLQFTAKQAPH